MKQPTHRWRIAKAAHRCMHSPCKGNGLVCYGQPYFGDTYEPVCVSCCVDDRTSVALYFATSPDNLVGWITEQGEVARNG